jgi:AbrB family looped-hinge helix DNA binding protein
MTSKGQTTIPRNVREFLNLKTGDRLEFSLNPDGKTVTVRAANIHVSKLRGMLKTDGMEPYRSDERAVALRKRAGRP